MDLCLPLIHKYLYPSQDKENTLPDFSVDAEPFVFCTPAPGKVYNQARVIMRVLFAQIGILQGQASKEAIGIFSEKKSLLEIKVPFLKHR